MVPPDAPGPSSAGRSHAAEPRALAPAIQLTIVAASLHGLLLSAALFLAG